MSLSCTLRVPTLYLLFPYPVSSLSLPCLFSVSHHLSVLVPSVSYYFFPPYVFILPFLFSYHPYLLPFVMALYHRFNPACIISLLLFPVLSLSLGHSSTACPTDDRTPLSPFSSQYLPCQTTSNLNSRGFWGPRSFRIWTRGWNVGLMCIQPFYPHILIYFLLLFDLHLYLLFRALMFFSSSISHKVLIFFTAWRVCVSSSE